MKVVKSIKTIRTLIKKAKAKGKTIGFVPTMGALHEGHLSLIRRCRKENDVVVVSIFVNPTQFGPNEDLEAYPRPKKMDVMFAKKEKVDITFYPSNKTMYPTGYLTYINVEKMFRNNYPKTVLSITDKGMRAFESYVNDLKKYIDPQK